MKLVDRRDDHWHEVPADVCMVAVPFAEWQLLGPAQWRTVRGTWPKALPVGLAVDNDVDVEDVAGDLDRFALVALRFPKWTDGRAYSQARLLRVRFGFEGELRATGDVVADMMPLLARTGFDAALLRSDQSPATAQRALGFFPKGHYQGDVIESKPHFARAAP